MDLVSSIIGIIGAIAGIGAVLIPIWLWLRSRSHPFLVPVDELLLAEKTAEHAGFFEIQIRNSGNAAAANIRGVILGPQQSLEGISLVERPHWKREKRFISGGAESVSLVSGRARLRGYRLFLPPGARSRARVTLLYEDTFGHTYASIFDYTDQQHWQQITFIHGIQRNLKRLRSFLLPAPVSEPVPGRMPRIDWGEAPHVEKFFGRQQELGELKRWLFTDTCRVVALVGIGGIGKTALAARLAEEAQEEFTSLFWRSLQNAPPVEKILEKSILFFSAQQHADIPEELDEQLLLLIHYMSENLCLLALDNVETIMQGGDRTDSIETHMRGMAGSFNVLERQGIKVACC